MSDRLLRALREATGARHAELDSALSLTTSEVTRDRYLSFLHGSLAAVGGIEAAIAPWCWPAERTRSDALRSDIETIGGGFGEAQSEPPALPAPDWLGSDAGALGSAYVLEGSTLGGLVLAKRVEDALGTTATAYLRFRGADTAKAWRAFLGVLDERDAEMGEREREQACAAAIATFERYREALVPHA